MSRSHCAPGRSLNSPTDRNAIAVARPERSCKECHSAPPFATADGFSALECDNAQTAARLCA